MLAHIYSGINHYSSNMGRGGHKIEQEDTCWESVWCDAPEAHRWGTGDERCVGVSPALQTAWGNHIWQVCTYQLGGRIELFSLLMRAGHCIIKEVGMIVSLYPLYISLIHPVNFQNNQVSCSYRSGKTYSFAQDQKSMTASCQGDKGGLEEGSGHWEVIHLLWKAVGPLWVKACQNVLGNMRLPRPYKRMVCAHPCSAGRSCPWGLPWDGCAWGSLKSCTEKTKCRRDQNLFPQKGWGGGRTKKEKQFLTQLSSSCCNNVFCIASKINPNCHHKHTPLRKSAFTAGFKHLPDFCSAELIPALNLGVTVTHRPVCGTGPRSVPSHPPGLCVQLLPLQPPIFLTQALNIQKKKSVGRTPFTIINTNCGASVNLGQCITLRAHYKFIRITAWRNFFSLASAAFSYATDL